MTIFLRKLIDPRSIKSIVTTGVLSSFILGASISTVCQPLNVDSTRKAIVSAKSDSSRILSMRNLAKYYLLHQLNEKEGFALLDSAEKDARRVNFYLGICNILLLRGSYAYQHGKWANALAYYKEQVGISQYIKDTTIRKRTLMSGYSNMGNIFNTNGDYANALEYYLKSLFIMETMSTDPTAISILHCNIASIYNLTNQYAKAEKYLNKMHPYLEAARPDLTALFWSEKMNVFKAKNDTIGIKSCIDSLTSAEKRLSMSKMQALTTKSTLLEMEAYFLSNYQHSYAGAIQKLEEKLAIAKEVDDNSQQYAAIAGLGELYFKLGDYNKAVVLLQQSYMQSSTDTVSTIAGNSAKLLSEIYNKTGEQAKAYFYLLTAYQLKEKVSSEEKLMQLSFLEANYQSEKREKEIATLTLSNAQKELALTKRNRTMWIGSLSAGAIVLLLAFMYKQSKNKQTIAEKEQKLKEEQIKFLERQQQVVSLQAMVNGQETERTRIAKDLHDGLGGLFSTVKMYFSTLEHEQPDLQQNELFRKSYDMVNTSATELRRIAHNMMPEVLLKLGLNLALQDLCNSMSAGRKLQVSLQLNGLDKRLNASIEIMLYRIIQELLNNIAKHANATEAIVQCIQNGQHLSVTVEDNGKGFDTNNLSEGSYAGLESVKSRVNYLNGGISIESSADAGTTIMMDFLINNE